MSSRQFYHLLGFGLAFLFVLLGVWVQIFSDKKQMLREGFRNPTGLWQAMQDNWLKQPDHVSSLLTVEKLGENMPKQVVFSNNQGELAYIDTMDRMYVVDSETGNARVIKTGEKTNILGFDHPGKSLYVYEYDDALGETVVSKLRLENEVKKEVMRIKSEEGPDEWWSASEIENWLIVPVCSDETCNLYRYNISTGEKSRIEIKNDSAVEFEPRMSILVFSAEHDRIFFNDLNAREYWVHDFSGRPYHHIQQYPQPDNEINWVGIDPDSMTLLFYSPLKKQVYYYDADYVHFDYVDSIPPAGNMRVLNHGFFTRENESGYELVNRAGEKVISAESLPVWWK